MIFSPGLTNEELRAAPTDVNVLTAPAISLSGPIALDAATLAALETISVNNITGTIVLPTGAATSALQTSANSLLNSIDTKLTAPLSVLGPLTDAELRAAAVAITGTVTATQSGLWNITNITGTVSLPTGAATETTLAALNIKIPTNPATDRTTATAPFANQLTDGTSFYDARQVRALTPSDVITANQGGTWSVTANAGTDLNTSALALETTQVTQNVRIGDLTEAAPGTDTASSGLNGRLQRIAQRLTSLIAQFPATLGQKPMATSLAVTLASDQTALDVTHRPQATAPFAPENSTSIALEIARVVKATPGTLYGITGYNNLNQAQFIHFYNTTAVPANGAIPVVVVRIAPQSSFSLDWGTYGRFFSTGICVSNSTTAVTRTAGAANCWFDVQYE